MTRLKAKSSGKMSENHLSITRQINAHIFGRTEIFSDSFCIGEHDATKVLSLASSLTVKKELQKFMCFLCFATFYPMHLQN